MEIPYPLQKTVWKQVCLAFVVIILAFGAACMTIAFRNRTYKPILSRQFPILLTEYLLCIPFFLGMMANLAIIDPVGVFENCIFWNHVAYLWLGVNLMLEMLMYRMLSLYFMLVLEEKPSGLKFWWPMIITYAPVCGYGIYGIAVPGSVYWPSPILLSSDVGCVPHGVGPWLILNGLTLFQLLALWFITVLVSRIRASFNEFKANVLINSLFTIALILQFVLVIVGNSSTPMGKVSILFFGVLAGTSLWLAPLFNPLFGLIFDKEAYLKKWEQRLQEEQAQLKSKLRKGHEKQLTPPSFRSNVHSSNGTLNRSNHTTSKTKTEEESVDWKFKKKQYQ